MKCDRCGEKEAIDIFPTAYNGEGDAMDEEALCEQCIIDDLREEQEWDIDDDL